MLPPGSVLGDYQLLHDENSNFISKSQSIKRSESYEKGQTFEIFQCKIMCVKSTEFKQICDLFPKSTERLKVSSFETHRFYQDCMMKLKELQTIKVLEESDNKLILGT